MTNEQAIGYALMAAKRLKLDKIYLHQLEINMRRAIDENTKEEAEEAYRKS